jgi:hypothetical protein
MVDHGSSPWLAAAFNSISHSKQRPCAASATLAKFGFACCLPNDSKDFSLFCQFGSRPGGKALLE